jgi:hypothetical protein
MHMSVTGDDAKRVNSFVKNVPAGRRVTLR